MVSNANRLANIGRNIPRISGKPIGTFSRRTRRQSGMPATIAIEQSWKWTDCRQLCLEKGAMRGKTRPFTEQFTIYSETSKESQIREENVTILDSLAEAKGLAHPCSPFCLATHSTSCDPCP